MNNSLSLTQALNSAIAFLSRREHARLELRHKLARQGFESQVIEQALSQLQADNLLSEERFVENYVYVRINKGYGPLRIQQELRERGISEDLLTKALTTDEAFWTTRASQVRQKRFGQDLPATEQDKAKQVRFLQYRGFTSHQIKTAISVIDDFE